MKPSVTTFSKNTTHNHDQLEKKKMGKKKKSHPPQELVGLYCVLLIIKYCWMWILMEVDGYVGHNLKKNL